MSKNVPTNKKLYARVKAEAKRKFDRWPSAYGSAWLVREYKKRGGGYRKAEMGMEVDNPYADMYSVGGGIMTGDYEMGYGGMPEYGYGGQEYSEGGMPEYKNGGGIPQRYRNMGFTKVGAKKKSTRPGKKWMVLAKKGDKYKVVHGGDSNMKDFKQHGSAKRKKRFWDRMGGRNSAKAKDPFSPLYWHKRFGTWAEGGETEFEPHMMYDPETGKGFMAEKYEDHVKMDKMGFTHDAPEMEYGGYKYGYGGKKYDAWQKGGELNDPSMDRTLTPERQAEDVRNYRKGGTNNPGFRALPPEVQDKIRANMKMGGIPEYQDAGTTYLPPAIRNMYPKEDPIYYDGMLNETTVTAPKYEGPQIRRATKDELAPVNSNFMFMGADKSGGLGALRAIGKGVKGLLGLKGAADEVAAGFNYAKGYGNPYQNMQISDDMFKGVANYGEDLTGEIAKGRLDFVRGLGKELDEVKFDANWMGPEHLRFHGTPGGRSVVEVAVPGKTHQTQLFYKSSGLAGKAGDGVNGTTQGLWQPYGGHANVYSPAHGYIPDWFIKDSGYKTYYNSKSFKDIAGRLDDLTKQAGFDMSGQAGAFKMGGSKPCFECGGTMKYGGTPKYQFAGTAGMNPFTQEEEEYMQQTYGTPADPTASMELPTLDLSPLENMVYEDVPEEMDNFEFIPGRSDNMRTTKNWMMQTPDGKLPTFTHKSGKKFNLDKAFETVDALSGLAGMAGRNAKRSRQLQQNKQRQFTDNLYDPIRAGEIGSRGDYNISGQFRPDRVANWNPYMAESFNTTPFYQEGGVTEMTDAEIERLRAMGADIEILD